MEMSKINTMENWLAQQNINDCNAGGGAVAVAGTAAAAMMMMALC